MHALKRRDRDDGPSWLVTLCAVFALIASLVRAAETLWDIGARILAWARGEAEEEEEEGQAMTIEEYVLASLRSGASPEVAWRRAKATAAIVCKQVGTHVDDERDGYCLRCLRPMEKDARR